MVNIDTFLTTLYVMVDDFCKEQLPPEKRPGPEASLSLSEVVTLAIFGQWARFQSQWDFYRYAHRHLQEAFPTLPDHSQFKPAAPRAPPCHHRFLPLPGDFVGSSLLSL